MGWLKGFVKRALFGKVGWRPRHVHLGLLRGLKFHIDPSSKSMRLIGFDEREIAGFVYDFARQARCALDIGANDGWYSLYFSSRENIQAVYAFEPSAACRNDFESNYALNDPAFRKKVVLVDKYVGSVDEGDFCTIDADFPNLPRPLLLKIDVDGGELDVLKGARNTLAAGDVSLIVETHSRKLERDCIAFLQELGYHPQVVPNGWYRFLLPEERRPTTQNRWLVAAKAWQAGSPSEPASAAAPRRIP